MFFLIVLIYLHSFNTLFLIHPSIHPGPNPQTELCIWYPKLGILRCLKWSCTKWFHYFYSPKPNLPFFFVSSFNKSYIVHQSQTAFQVKRALGRITMNKASGGDAIPAELFQILKWCCECAALNMPANLETKWPQDWKNKFSFQSQIRAMWKNVETTAQLHLFYMLAR